MKDPTKKALKVEIKNSPLVTATRQNKKEMVKKKILVKNATKMSSKPNFKKPDVSQQSIQKFFSSKSKNSQINNLNLERLKSVTAHPKPPVTRPATNLEELISNQLKQRKWRNPAS